MKHTLIYVFLGTGWIFATDWMARQMSNGFDVHLIQTFKGLIYILGTALVVYWLTRQALIKTQLQEKLRTTENVFRATLRNLGEAVILVKSQARVIDEFNAAAESIFGYSREEVMGKSTEFLHVDGQSFEQFGVISEAELDEHGVFRGEYQMKRKDGTIIDTANSITAINEDFGWKGGVVSIVSDITDSKRSQEMLRKSEKRYRLLADNTLDVIWTMDKDLRFTYVNPAINRLQGYYPEEFAGTHLADHCDEAAYDKAKKAIVEVIAKGGTQDGALLEMKLLRKDGSSVPVEVHGSALFDEEGSLIGIQGTTRDITERQKSRQRLEDSERRFRTMFEETSDGVGIADIETGAFLFVNPALARMLGYTEEELGRLKVSNIHPEKNLPEVHAAFKLVSQGKKDILTSEVPCVKKGGEIIYAEINATGMDIDGTRRAVGFFRDVTELRAAQRRQNVLLDRIKSLRRIDQTILSQLPLEMVMRQIAQETQVALDSDAVSILIRREPQHHLETTAALGFTNSVPEDTILHLDEGYVGRALMNRKAVTVSDLQTVEPEFERRDMAAAEGFHGYACCPIIVKGNLEGVLEIFKRESAPPGSDQIEFLQILAGEAAIAIDNVSTFEELQKTNERLLLAYDSSIEGWSRALDYRDKETEGHSRRVTEITVELARRAGVDEAMLKYVRWGALLHDIGKMGVPDHILLKPGKLTDEEWEIIKRHPVVARNLLRPIKYLEQAIDIPYCHHERWDGSGYPQGLKGEDIPQAAQIFAIVDVWDALRSDRPYRKGWSEAAVLDHLKKNAGSHFNPELVNLFSAAMHEIPACSSPVYGNEQSDMIGGDA
jgi:PAS domain S-box-containing protein/putative nucleotidyltransferase with HDIG domain